MEFKNILVAREDNIVIVTINREKVLNALNDETINELLNFFRQSWKDSSIGCVIITGAGKSFIAGADISELRKCDVAGATKTSRIGHYLMRTIEDFPRPVIAAINGFALGGGCELAISCDIRLASEKAKLGQPEVSLGIIPGYGGTQRLPRLVGRGKAKQLIFSGEMIDAAEAYRIGLVDEVYSPEELMNKAMELAKSIASRGPVAVSLAKECINHGLDVNLRAGCDFEKNSFGVVYGSSDTKEGLTAFLEKRPPKFKGE
jgi:enoyl-CoA hydratase